MAMTNSLFALPIPVFVWIVLGANNSSFFFFFWHDRAAVCLPCPCCSLSVLPLPMGAAMQGVLIAGTHSSSKHPWSMHLPSGLPVLALSFPLGGMPCSDDTSNKTGTGRAVCAGKHQQQNWHR